MRLIVFAHRAEALTFIKQGNFKAVESATKNLYSNSDDFLLICGEGIFNSLEAVSSALAENRSTIKSVLNFGIAGSLDSSIEIDSICEIRTFYAQREKEVEFKSYSSDAKTKFDCITSSKRALDGKYAEYLSCFAQVVDREAWAIARASNNYNIPFNSYKLISDFAIDNSKDIPICDYVKEKAEIYSDKLWRFFLKLEKRTEVENKLLISNYNELYFTVSQYRQYQNILSSLLTKYSSEKEILEVCALDEILELKLTEKNRSQKLLEKMRELQTPFNHELANKLEEVISPLKKAQLNIKLSKDYESDTFSFSARVSNKEELAMISNALKRFDFEKYKSLLRGNFDV
jgi:nucleoside phosphorylase